MVYSRSISKGYSLLYNLYMEPEGNGIENIPVRTLWQSHAAFSDYNEKMIRLTKKHKKVVMQVEADIQHDMNLIPDKSMLVWYTHPAKELLKKDVQSGVASTMDPKDLRETRIEYDTKIFQFRNFVLKYTMRSNVNGQCHFGSGSGTRRLEKCTRAK
jgi:hypothetical protein